MGSSWDWQRRKSPNPSGWRTELQMEQRREPKLSPGPHSSFQEGLGCFRWHHPGGQLVLECFHIYVFFENVSLYMADWCRSLWFGGPTSCQKASWKQSGTCLLHQTEPAARAWCGDVIQRMIYFGYQSNSGHVCWFCTKQRVDMYEHDVDTWRKCTWHVKVLMVPLIYWFVLTYWISSFQRISCVFNILCCGLKILFYNRNGVL